MMVGWKVHRLTIYSQGMWPNEVYFSTLSPLQSTHFFHQISWLVFMVWHNVHPEIWGQWKKLLKESDTWISSLGQKWFERIFMTTGLWLSLTKNNDKIMSTDLGFNLVKNGLREFLCRTGQITKINENLLAYEIQGVVWYLKCSGGYGRAERIDLSELKVVRIILISKSEGEGRAWMASWLKEVG